MDSTRDILIHKSAKVAWFACDAKSTLNLTICKWAVADPGTPADANIAYDSCEANPSHATGWRCFSFPAELGSHHRPASPHRCCFLNSEKRHLEFRQLIKIDSLFYPRSSYVTKVYYFISSTQPR